MHVPVATYRIQFCPDFGFDAARTVVPYLSALGISDIYASPIFRATAGSQHGYDVVDPNMINDELGSEAAFRQLVNDLRNKSMSWIQDFVPNHMAYDHQNAMLMSVFELQERSPFYEYFDIDWQHPYESFQGRLMAPFLGRFYSECLEDGELRLSYDAGGLAVNYYELKFPLLISTYQDVLKHDLARLEQAVGPNDPELLKYLGVIDLFSLSPEKDSAELVGQVKHAKAMLWEIYGGSAPVHEFLDENIRIFNGTSGQPASFSLLDHVLSKQCYRLAFWKVASEELNYRRFFTINNIISVRVQDEKVFHYTHGLLTRLVKEGLVHGVRIDHVDGLYNPTLYLKRLREKLGDTYILVEKILGYEENLPDVWPIQGSTGYNFLRYVNNLLCHRDHHTEFVKLYYKFTALPVRYEQLVREKKRLIIEKHMTGDLDNLAYLMKRVAARDRYGRDITLHGLRQALIEVMINLSVYRTYIEPGYYADFDRRIIAEAIENAHVLNPALVYELDFVRKFLELRYQQSDLDGEEWRQLWHFIMRFQQICAPIMAKGFEDTVFYIYNKLISLNEVGGEPSRFGCTLPEFHAFQQERAGLYPYAMNATATHDTKRGEDVRARINVLSEIPAAWKDAIHTWRKLNRTKRRKRDERHMPDDNDEYFIYQSLIGGLPFDPAAWPEFEERMTAFVIKAVREAKVHTAWIKPDEEYEEACRQFVARLMDTAEKNRFWHVFYPFQQKVAFYGILNSLTQTVLKLTCPGVPDIYQGTELWELSFVDPDNRRPVDYALRRRYLDELQQAAEQDVAVLLQDLLTHPQDGRIKMFVLHRLLQVRQRQPAIFAQGDYIPLQVEGKHAQALCAFVRRSTDRWVLVMVPRFATTLTAAGDYPLGEVWQDTRVTLPPGAPDRWHNVFTDTPLMLPPGKPVPAATVCLSFPHAVFLSD